MQKALAPFTILERTENYVEKMVCNANTAWVRHPNSLSVRVYIT
jgi:hypothetical protein